MTSYVPGPYGQLLMISDAPTGDKVLTSTGWVEKTDFSEALVGIAVAAGSEHTLAGLGWEDVQIAALTVNGNGFTNGVKSNEIIYNGTPSGSNHFLFEAKLVFTSPDASGLEVEFGMFHNDVLMDCSNSYYQTKTGSNKTTVIVLGCGVMASGDVVAIKEQSNDGVTLTIEKVRWMGSQAR